MVSVTGTQHRHVAAGATKQVPGDEDANTRGKSEASVGHMARALAAARPDDYAGPSAQGQAAAYIAKLSLDARAALLEELKNPPAAEGSADPADPADPIEPTDGTPPVDGTTPPTDGASPPPADEPTTPPTDGAATLPTDGTPPPADAAIAILDEIIAAAEENNEPV